MIKLKSCLFFGFFLSCFFIPLNGYADVDLQKARQYIQQNNLPDAIEELKKGVSTESQSERQAPILNTIGWSFLKLGNYAESEKYLTASYQHAMNNGDVEQAGVAANNLGILFFLQNDIEKASFYFGQPFTKNTKTAKDYQPLLEEKRKELQLQKSLTAGVAARMQKDFSEAIKNYNAALSIDGDNAKILEYKGYALYRSGDLELALQTLETARAIDPNRGLIDLNLLKVHCSLNNEENIKNVLVTSLQETDAIKNWFSTDGELRRVCKSSQTLMQLVQSN